MPDGAASANQPILTNPGMAASATVGTSGNCATLLLLVMAKGLIFPDFAKPAAAGRLPTIKSICPEAKSVRAGPSPL